MFVEAVIWSQNLCAATYQRWLGFIGDPVMSLFTKSSIKAYIGHLDLLGYGPTSVLL
jgi:hypothetical protein